MPSQKLRAKGSSRGMSEMPQINLQTTSPTAEPHGAKRVAIKLRGISAIDRRWMMGQLTDSQRQAVAQADEELTAIIGNLQLDFSVFLEVTEGTALLDTAMHDHPLNSCDYLAVKRLLDQLPLSQVAMLVASGVWLATDRYLKALPPKRRKALETARTAIPSRHFAHALADIIAKLTEEPVNG